MIKTKDKTHGFIALTAVLILSAILLSVAIGASSRSIASAGLSVAESERQRAKALAHLCAEYALIELERTLQYAGDEAIVVGGESCDILTVTGTGNLNRTIQTESTVSRYTHRTEISVSEVSPNLIIASWDEVSSF